MVTLQTINEVAIRWNKTKDPKDKDLWYKLIKEYGLNNTKRRDVSSSSGNERNAEESDDNRQGKLF
jgi:ABC-type cobalamin/Fe3+-siderophores transport system ATPase subunit